MCWMCAWGMVLEAVLDRDLALVVWLIVRGTRGKAG